MAWTYNNSPGTGSSSERRDAVRVLIGDTDTNDQQLTDEEIQFALSETSDAIYRAAAMSARMVAAAYSRLVDQDFEGLSLSYSKRQEHYERLAADLEKQARQRGSVGIPSAGGISIDTMDNVEEQNDRPEPAFKRRQFRHPGRPPDVEQYDPERE